MGSYRTTKVGEGFFDVFTVFDFDLVSVVTGEPPSAFTVTFSRDAAEVLAVPFVISEIGTTGTYCLEVPDGFPSVGLWAVTVFVDYNGSVWRSHVEVRVHDVDDVYGVIVQGGSGAETATIRYQDVANGNVLVPDLLIYVYDTLGTLLVSFARSNTSGIATFLLDVGTYVVRAFKPGVSSIEQQIVVPIGGGTFTLDCESIQVSPPTSPQLCRLYANFISGEGLPFQKFKLQVQNQFDPASLAGLAVVDRVRVYESDSNGHVEFDVVRGTRVQVVFVTTPLTRTFVVPDKPVENVLTLMGSATNAFQVVRK